MANDDGRGQGSTSAKKLAPNEEQIARVTEKLTAVRRRIAAATKAAKRADEPRLVAISKLHPPTTILAAHLHTNPQQLHFGENYAQELEAKARVLPRSIRWHFVGKLQSNKAKMVAEIPNLYLVETLDSIKLANVLNKVRSQVERDDAEPLGVYLQVNTSGEENKGGLEPLRSEDGDTEKSEVVRLAVHVITECTSLQLRGLMTIGAAANSRQEHETEVGDEDATALAARARAQNPDFDTLYRTREALVQILRTMEAVKVHKERYAGLLQGDDDETGGLELSMGMSADLEVAVGAGSGNVRVGTDCFGVRPPSRDEAMQSMDEELQSR